MDDLQEIRKGPLAGKRVIEFAGIGPAPFACMLLSDMGAEVIRIERLSHKSQEPLDIVARGRTRISLDLKEPDDVARALELLTHADVLIEGFRPGVMERLGLGPDEVSAKNPKLVYARMTGWGQEGPLAQAAGHDINYIALTGALAAIGPSSEEPPVPPLNLLGDYGGGSLYLVVGVLAALLEAQRSGKGQVVDAAICDGVLSLMSNNLSHLHRGLYHPKRASNMLDGGAPYYSVYGTADGGWVSLGPIEPQFFELLCSKLNLPTHLWDSQHDRTRWPALRDAIAAAIQARSRQWWCEVLEGTDVCFAPVLTLQEAANHPHLRKRACLVETNDVLHVAPAPRFSRTPSSIKASHYVQSENVDEFLRSWSTAVKKQSPMEKDNI